MPPLSDLGEFGLIRRLTSHLKSGKDVLLGPGDDCAVIRVRATGRSPLRQLLTTDLLIEGVHFHRDWMSARQIGFKAMRVNLSDIAAMGGRPRFVLVSVGLPKSFPLREATALFKGLERAAKEAGAVIVGGDTNASDRLILNVALIGDVPSGRCLTRSGARVGDRIYVSGTLGDAALGLEILKRRKTGGGAFVRRHKIPPDRVRVGRFVAGLSGVHALIDLSDGLAGDLRHILDAGDVGADILLDRIPLSPRFRETTERLGLNPMRLALGGGEDYELLWTASPRVKMPRKIRGVPVTFVGTITPKQSGVRFFAPDGRRLKVSFGGFRHF